MTTKQSPAPAPASAPAATLSAANVPAPDASLEFIAAAKANGSGYRAGETTFAELADSAAGVLRNASYSVWMSFSKYWQEGYGGKDAQKAWERFVKLVQVRNPDIEKPKAPSAKAQTVSAERKAEKAKVDVLASQPRATLQQQAKVLVEKGDADSLRQLGVVQKAMKVQAMNEVTEVKAAFSANKKEARARITALKFNGVHRNLLEKVLGMLPEVPPKAESDDEDEDGEF